MELFHYIKETIELIYHFFQKTKVDICRVISSSLRIGATGSSSARLLAFQPVQLYFEIQLR